MDNQGICVSEVTGDVRPIVSCFYRMEGPDFFSQHHKLGGGLCEAIDDTCKSFSGNSEFYVVNKGKDTVAFFVKTVTEGISVLEGFHIKKDYRNARTTEEFWNIVRLAFNDEFYIGILEGNEPALRHLMRNGFIVYSNIESEGKRFILLKNKLI